ncbi:hypothetical protein F0U44_16170 [Nocardioides humilatus]|uniref:Uncharacterized protein n=1 Tax=Nocardioides humilatus TaxID=2607660 RepID=A0A5B1LDK5_9ACTN|nr:hypothetical protein [Nocardioides humilatus]KAA1417819.1 hypothetical protein F0U44_16170 [Nocardioides humilatus]
MRITAARILSALALTAAAVTIPAGVSADAAPPPDETHVTFSPGQVNFSKVKVGETKSRKVTLHAKDGWYLLGGSDDGVFSWGDSTCVGQPKCTVVATFAPIQVGPKAGTLGFTMCPPAEPNMPPCVDVPLETTGTGVAPVKFAPAKVNFGNVEVGTSKDKKVGLKIDDGWYLNSGGGDGPFYWSDSTCVGQPRCYVKATFDSVIVGPTSGQLLFVICRSGGPNPPPNCVDVYVPVTGNGT